MSIMEEFLDAVTGGAIWGVGFGLGLAAMQAVGQGLRPVAKGTLRGAMSVGDWLRDVSAEARENLEDTYHEARAELNTQAGSKTGSNTPRAT
jgi:hypothetical protein